MARGGREATPRQIIGWQITAVSEDAFGSFLTHKMIGDNRNLLSGAFLSSTCGGYSQGHYCADFLVCEDKNHQGVTPWWSQCGAVSRKSVILRVVLIVEGEKEAVSSGFESTLLPRWKAGDPSSGGV